MKKEIVVNRAFEETRVAVLEDDVLTDLFMERRESEKILNNIYKGKVQNIVPGLSSAFVDIGFGKSAYLSMSDIVAPKNERKIENMLKEGQDIMVQVYKEPISTKGPKVTMDISLPGRLLVYMPFSKNIGISKQIEDPRESGRLKGIVKELKKELAGGVIIRTEAEDAAEEEIEREIKYLSRLWASVLNRFNISKVGTCVHKDLGVVFQTVRDHFTEDVKLMHIDNGKELKDVKEFVRTVSPELEDRIVLYDEKKPIFEAYGIEDEIKKLKSNKVHLKSGGYLIIQEAESLCAIDVNSGKFTGDENVVKQEDVITLTNVEAAKETARQLRLRNIGGIIVIDFIDMKRERHRKKVLETLRQAAKNDKAKIKVWPITHLGLIEMTRERKKESLFALLGETCPTCHGLGVILSKESVFTSVCHEIEKMKTEKYFGKIKIKLHPEVAQYFCERQKRLNELFKNEIIIIPSDSVTREDYNIILEQQ